MGKGIQEKKRATKLGVICYSLGDLASQFVWTFVGAYLTIFYTDIVGLAPAIASAIMLGARVWDAVNDPMMGAIAERTRTKLGRFRPYIAFGCPFLAVFSVLCFTHPFAGNTAAGIIWAAVIYILAGMLYTLVNIPYGSLASVMTEDGEQRNQINVSRNIGMNIGTLIVNAVTASMMLRFSGKGAEVASGRGYLMTVIVYAVISIPLFLAVFATSKEVIQPKEKPGKFSVKEVFESLLKNKYLMVLFAIMCLQMLQLMGRISVMAYYAIYCLGNFRLIATIMTLPSLCGIISSFLLPAVIKKLGKKKVMMTAFFIQAAALVVVYLTPFDNILMVMLGCCIYGFCNITYPCALSMIQDCVDWYDLKAGVRTDAIAISVLGLAQKLGNAVGASVGLIIIGAFGYIANAQQTERALSGINLVVNLLPAIICLLCGIGLQFYKLSDKDADQVREKLRERNQPE